MWCFLKFYVLFLFVILGLVSNSIQTKKVNCRKYVYAPVCRGVAAKRAIPKYPNSIRDTRESSPLDLDALLMDWKDKDKESNGKGLLHIIIQKLDPRTTEYDSDITDIIDNDLN